ncbi:MAG: hypothetical protein HeimC3_02980 [Candidatus Heimdallarchaeota archaeon LC_3]|nr:MAG: hypothetical protein HeimC3_02980 [Candidatus Heimdallarchaeota archaeon LC_3]
MKEITCLMSEEAYKKFLKFVLEYANPALPHSTWQETIGFLFGKFEDSDNGTEVRITDVLPMDSGSSVFVKIGDYAPIYEELIKKGEKGEFIVGWIHSHPGLQIFLSGTDVSTQRLYQQMDSRAVAIVVDHTTITESFPGLKAFRVDKNSYHGVDLKIESSNDFFSIFKELKDEISVISPPKLLKERISISLENIVFNIEGPNYWFDNDELINIELKYSIGDLGLLNLEFQPILKGAFFYRKNKKIFRYQLYDKGLLVKFGIIPDHTLQESINLELIDIKVYGKDKIKKTTNSIVFNIKKG